MKALVGCHYSVQELMVSPTQVSSTLVTLSTAGGPPEASWLVLLLLPVWDPQLKAALLPHGKDLKPEGKVGLSVPLVL